MTILLVRHGETLLNTARVLQPADTPLSPRGLAQARALGQRLAAAPLTAIVSSDLPRALQTAEAIAEACGLPIAIEPLLQERNYGDLRGRPYDSLPFDPMTYAEAPPAGESMAQFRHRVAAAFAHVVALRQALGGDLAVVTHGLVISAMLELHARFPDTLAAPSRLANASLTRLAERAPHGVTLVNCTAHLDVTVGDDPLALSGG